MRNAGKGQTRRAANGQGLIEGVCGLVIVTIGAVLGILLLVNTGVSAFYKERVGFVTQKAADFAAMKFGEASALDETRKFTNDILKETGLPNLQDIKLEKVLAGGKDAVRVRLVVSGLTLVGNGEVLPKSINIEDAAVSPVLAAGSTDSGEGTLQFVLVDSPIAYSVTARAIKFNRNNIKDDKINQKAPTFLFSHYSGGETSKRENPAKVSLYNSGLSTANNSYPDP